MQFNVITRCTRPENLFQVKKSIDNALKKANDGISIRWHIIFDTSVVKTIHTDVSKFLYTSSSNLYYLDGTPGDMGHSLLNIVIDKIDNENSWVYFLDDDNEMHEDLLLRFVNEFDHRFFKAFVFSQFVNYKDFTNLEIREASIDNMCVRKIDMAQFILKRELIGEHRFVPNEYTADGIFIEELYKKHTACSCFLFSSEVLCSYNSLQKTNNSYFLPRVLILDEDLQLKTHNESFESCELNIETCADANAPQKISKFNPDAIVSFGESFDKYPHLMNLSSNFRERWIHIQDKTDEYAGDKAYYCGMHFALKGDQNLVSIVTPIFNTKEKLRRTYLSLVNQSYSNWEWVLVNDSTDTLTIEIANELASKDPRIKIYDFKDKTKGIIGEAKYRGFALSSGIYIVELDHDDYLLPDAITKTVEAFAKYPDAGFVYSDCAEIDEQYNSLTYGEGFSFGYGSYKEEEHLGMKFKVASTANINPLTIRHIVGVPNHLRAWRRDIYFKVGGHNRRLSIADDYELIIRTFLETRFTKIPVCCYLQFYHGNNSQNESRADIQRRVKTISLFYNDKIKDRFENLGKTDWAYIKDRISWNLVKPQFGEEEQFVNYIL